MNELNNKVEINSNEQVIQLKDGRVELFRQIPDFDKYWIGINGTVLSLQFGKKRELKQRVDKDGYHHVTISNNKVKKSFLVHRLVAQAFLYGFDKSLEVDHVNNRRDDNRAENLQMLSHRDNLKKRTKNRKKYVRLNETQKELIKMLYIPKDEIFGFRNIARHFDISPQTLKNILYN